MPIQVKFFASLRERIGRAADAVPAAQARTVADVWAQAAAGVAMPPNTLAAVNLEYVDLSHAVREGDEVAFFPPVTGG
ncbi:MAG TPA: MoaD/ThiS family protein [Burkholderiales bacterium]|jgi:molybdopterin synthase sulfur carrier subunit